MYKTTLLAILPKKLLQLPNAFNYLVWNFELWKISNLSGLVYGWASVTKVVLRTNLARSILMDEGDG